jgi:hypothetical protein
MSNLHSVEFTLEERHRLVGELDCQGSTRRENGQQAEGAEFSAAFDELTPPSTVSLALEH